MSNLHIKIQGIGGCGKTTVALKIRDMLSLDEMFKDQEVFIFHYGEDSDAEIKETVALYGDAVFIYDGFLDDNTPTISD